MVSGTSPDTVFHRKSFLIKSLSKWRQVSGPFDRFSSSFFTGLDSKGSRTDSPVLPDTRRHFCLSSHSHELHPKMASDWYPTLSDTVIRPGTTNNRAPVRLDARVLYHAHDSSLIEIALQAVGPVVPIRRFGRSNRCIQSPSDLLLVSSIARLQFRSNRQSSPRRSFRNRQCENDHGNPRGKPLGSRQQQLVR